jgi:hypothetical protein
MGAYRVALLAVAMVGVHAACSDSGPGAGVADAGVVDAGFDAPVVVDAGVDAGNPCDGVDAGADGLSDTLSCTGLYKNIATKELATGVAPYTPANQFWSDGAEKSRFVLIPAGTKIDTTDMDAWQYPVGMKVWKEFRRGGKRVETRIFYKRAAGSWSRTTYRWNAAESEATRLDRGELAVGGSTYEIPRASQCDICHNGRPDALLGFDAIGVGVAGATGMTLAKLAADGWLTQVPAKTSLSFPEDGTGKAAAALAYVHTNCGGCHNPLAGANAQFTGLYMAVRASQLITDVPVSGLDISSTAVGVASTSMGYNDGTWYRIAPGNPAKSESLDRATRRDEKQMPAIVSHEVDVVGVDALRQWIQALP